QARPQERAAPGRARLEEGPERIGWSRVPVVAGGRRAQPTERAQCSPRGAEPSEHERERECRRQLDELPAREALALEAHPAGAPAAWGCRRRSLRRRSTVAATMAPAATPTSTQKARLKPDVTADARAVPWSSSELVRVVDTVV